MHVDLYKILVQVSMLHVMSSITHKKC